MYQTLLRRLRGLACIAVLFALPANASAQFGGGGFGGLTTTEIVILLGPDYDPSKAKPFLDGYELSNDPFLRQSNIVIPVNSVLIDNTTELPTQGGITVQARYPEAYSADEKQTFEKELKLKALRYGLTNVEFRALPIEEESIWLRAGYPSGGFQQLDISKLLAAAADLSTVVGGRLEIYDETRFDTGRDLPRLAHRDSPFMEDPFAPGPGGENPFGASPGGEDPFAAGPAGDDPFSAPPSIENLEVSLQRWKALQTELAGQVKTIVAEYKTSTDESHRGQLKRRLTQVVDQMFLARLKVQTVELSQMRLKLSNTESMLKTRAAQRVDLVRQRVESLVQ